MKVKHGSRATYERHGCRCTDCTAAYREWRRTNNERRQKRVLLGGLPSSVKHGRMATYKNWWCRCAECRAAQAAYQRDYTVRVAARDEGTEGAE